jgi:DNA-directed RNA polymerase subunit RPC12/RpoP
MNILVPVSTSDKVVSFSDYARNKLELGKLTYEQFCNIEMLELGYNPSNPEDVLEYECFIEALSEEDFKIPNFTDNLPEYISKTVFGPVKSEEDRWVIVCSECDAQHLVIHMEWELIVCLHCGYEILNPEKEG